MFQRYLIWIGWIAVIALACDLRLSGLDIRPIHADEATGARICADLIEDKGYEFNPTHYHGPFLSLSTLPFAGIFGQGSWQEFSLSMLRSGPALAGILMVLTPLLWLRIIGPGASLAAAALLACSPLLVYYNRMYIHESWLALFGMLTAAAIYNLIKNPSRNRAIFAGLLAGLMFATKETVAISLLAWTFAGLILWLRMKVAPTRVQEAPAFISYFQPALWFAVAMLLTGALFYTQGFRHPQGLIDAFRTYFVYETVPGHEKPFGYYFKTLLQPKHTLGLWWSEGMIAAFALLACILGVLRKKGTKPLLFIGISVLLHILIYSLIDYKTPWLMTVPWALACLLAGCIFMTVDLSKSRGKAVLLYICFGIGLCYQTYQSVHANGRLSNDPRNPYAYVPTSKNITQLPNWLQQLENFKGGQNLQPIAVVGQGYWPLPWYLRGFKEVGYWPEPPEEIASFPLVISMPGKMTACNQMTENSHTRLPRTLRSDVPVTLYLKNEIWTAWTKPSNE